MSYLNCSVRAVFMDDRTPTSRTLCFVNKHILSTHELIRNEKVRVLWKLIRNFDTLCYELTKNRALHGHHKSHAAYELNNGWPFRADQPIS